MVITSLGGALTKRPFKPSLYDLRSKDAPLRFSDHWVREGGNGNAELDRSACGRAAIPTRRSHPLPTPEKIASVPTRSSINIYRKLAATMDRQMRQLALDGITGTAVIGPMLGHIADLHQIWTAVPDKQLALLFQAYPEFHRYAALMEEGKEVDLQRAGNLSEGSAAAALAHSLAKPFSLFMTNGKAIERGFRSILDDAGQPGWRKRVSELVRLHRAWTVQLGQYKTTLATASISEESLKIAIAPLEALSEQIRGFETLVRGDRTSRS